MELSKGIMVLADELCKLQDEADLLASKLKAKTDRINEIKRKDLAEMMDTEGIQVGSKFKLANGKTINVKEFFTSNIPSLTNIAKEKDPFKQGEMQERRLEAFDWLTKQGKGDIIKNTVVASFKREEGEKAKQLMEWLIQKGIMATRDENVHSSTLNATLKEALGNGEQVPLELFNITRGIVVDLK